MGRILCNTVLRKFVEISFAISLKFKNMAYFQKLAKNFCYLKKIHRHVANVVVFYFFPKPH